MRILLIIGFLFMFLNLNAQKSYHFEINWPDYLESSFDGSGVGSGEYYLDHFLSGEIDLTQVTFDNLEWELILNEYEISVLNSAQPFMGIYASVYYSAGSPVLSCRVNPFKTEGEQVFRLKSFDAITHERTEVLNEKSKTHVSNSILASGKWIKLSVGQRGVYKVTYDRMKELGIEYPERVGVYGNGGAMLPKMNNEFYPGDLVLNPVLHGVDVNGKKCIFFFVPGNHVLNYNPSTGLFGHQINLYSEKSFYFLSSDAAPSPAVASMPEPTGNPETVFTTFDAYNFIEKEINNPIRSGRQMLGENLKPLTRITYSFNNDNIVPGSQAIVTVAGAGRSSDSSFFEIYINGAYRDKLYFYPVEITSEYSQYASHSQKSWSFTPSNKTEVLMNYLSEKSGGDAWIDFVSINAKAKLAFTGSTLHFRNATALTKNIVGYQIEGFPSGGLVWDVTDPLSPRRMETPKAGGALPAVAGNFLSQGSKIAEFVAFNPLSAQIPEPTFVENVVNQNIKGAESAELIIVTHPEFLLAANRLAAHRRSNDGLSVMVLTTTQVFNEFSSGIPDVAAIRNMARYFYANQLEYTTPLRYLLLVGDGHYNNRNSEKSFIPTYQSENSLHKIWSFVTDDFFGLLDENEGEIYGYLDIGVGRLTCKTKREADIIVDKIIRYDSTESQGEWRNRISFIADDEDFNIHMIDTEKLIDTVQAHYPGFYIEKIYFDAFQQKVSSGSVTYPEVTEAINRRVKEGTLILNYVGHANSKSLAHENVLQISDINTWDNANRLPVFVTATCDFGQFDDDDDSAGEKILSSPNGGGVGLFTTTRVVYSNANYNLSNNFYRSIFEHDEKDEKLRLGEVMRRAKNATRYDTNKLNFTLLADPSMRLAFPKYNVITTSINKKNIDSELITIGALEKVTVTGEIIGLDDQRLTSFNGEITSMMYDKEMTIKTLANDGGMPFVFNARNNMVYKGVSKVVNGVFEFSFVVPKDISYQVGKGKLYHYASNGLEDANGSTDDFLIGGTGKNPITENNPPRIELFMNDENFKPYGKVASNALLIVKLFDETGINTVGAGIGHDLIAILDDDYSNPFILNDFYVSKTNSYQEGTIVYPVNNLSPGQHKIKVKVWDVQNNSSEEEIYFVVDEGFEIFQVVNFPNPVATHTNFSIKHNLPGELFDVTVELFALDGKKVHEFEQSAGSSGGVVSRLRWDLAQANIPITRNKLLVYRIVMKSKQGQTATGTGKLFLKN